MTGPDQERIALSSTLRTPEQMEWIRDRFKPDGLERLSRADRDYCDGHGNYLPDVAALAHAALAALDVERERVRTLEEALLALFRDDRSPSFGCEHCVCGTHATPYRDCPVHWALAILEHHGVDYTALLVAASVPAAHDCAAHTVTGGEGTSYCACPAGSYDHPNVVHEPYCPAAPATEETR